MNLQILDASTRSVTIKPDRSPPVYFYNGDAYLSVCVLNAFASVRRQGGKVFHGSDRWQQARASYKSAAVQAAIDLAELRLTAGALTP